MINLDFLHLDLKSKIQKSKYYVDLLENNLQPISYISNLRTLAIIYGTLEYQLSKQKQPKIINFLKNYTPKLPLILEDLEYLEAKKYKDIIPAVSNSLFIADKILMYSQEKPINLIAALYMLDALQLEKIEVNKISTLFELKEEKGICFYLHFFSSNYELFWNEFKKEFISKTEDEQEQKDILSFANEFIINILAVYQSFIITNENMLGNHVTSLNPEAGNYPIPTNPKEIEAAIIAGMKTWHEFPYYEKRYGERGKRFTISDSAWLVTLSDLPLEYAIPQTIWLAKYLANKGMPTVTMEHHLFMLYSELVKLLPENQKKYEKLLLASQEIKKQNLEKIPISIYEKIKLYFENISNKINTNNFLQNIEKLLLSSIADNLNGIEETTETFKTWITNKTNSTDDFIEIIEKIYSQSIIEIEKLKN